ncbi:MAG: hypothetical protein JNK04_26435, partial [Myxococcales bacterium]|nr:hypothetical protein [Myxococcales bacterium]
MSALIELTAQGVAPEAEARGTRLRCESKPNLEIEGEHSRLAQVLLAVFCHALRAADTSEPITGRVHEAEGWATLKLAFT